jgi:hypothetical protein
MMVNKWTIGLASAGLVSLASVARAEEKANMVQTALAATSISGYVDTSAQWNVGTGNSRLPVYKFGGASKADGFNLDVVQIRIDRPLDPEDWAAGYRVDMWAGPDANTLGTQSILATGSSDFALRQAYVALRMPLGTGIDWKVGVFDSIIGYESVESPNDPNYTRSYGHSIEPQTHTGILASYRFTDMVSVSGGIGNTIGPSINEKAQFFGKAESLKTYMGSVAVTAPDNFGALSGSTLYAGIVTGPSSRPLFNNVPGGGVTAKAETQTSWYVGSTLATPWSNLRLGAAFDFLERYEHGETWSLGGYTSFQATEKLSLHGRIEYLRDRGEQKFFTGVFQTDPDDPTTASVVGTNPDKVLALTGTVQYDLWKNVITRLEVRWDHSLSGQETWGETNPTTGEGSLKNEVLLAANLIYKF